MNAISDVSTALFEPSFADMIERIEDDDTRPKDKKVHWRCSIGIISKGLGKDLSAIPARWTAIKFAVGELHHERMDSAAKTLASHRANLKAAFRWLFRGSRSAQAGHSAECGVGGARHAGRRAGAPGTAAGPDALLLGKGNCAGRGL